MHFKICKIANFYIKHALKQFLNTLSACSTIPDHGENPELWPVNQKGYKKYLPM